MSHRLILPALAAVLLAAAGCQSRGSGLEVDELRAENQRLTDELNKLYGEARLLEHQRNEARTELAKYREQVEGLQAQLKRVGSSLDPKIFDVTDRGLVVKDVAFNLGSAELTDEALAALRQLASQLNSGEYAGTKVFVVGHTDDTPVVRPETVQRFGDNWGLSAMRAAAVVRVLQEFVSADRLHGAFRGQHEPLPGADGKSANRRVEIRLAL